MSRELVVARYSEDFDWTFAVAAAGVPVTVYDKSTEHPTGILQAQDWRRRGLPNVGREGHSYLWHIVHNWERLADWTVFCQGAPWDHVGPDGIDRLLRTEDARFAAVRICRCVEWDFVGTLVYTGQWGEWYRDGTIQPCPLNMASWFWHYLCMGLPLAGLEYTPGACFGASREAIRSRPHEFYTGLLRSVAGHRHPESSYYLERAWKYILSA